MLGRTGRGLPRLGYIVGKGDTAMADDKPEDTTPETTEEAALRKAKVGVKDKNQTVHTALDQPVSGILADLADGDD
jgi:hypothetical protein